MADTNDSANRRPYTSSFAIRPSTSRCIEYDLPTSRDFIRHNPNAAIADLHADPNRIGPVWTKISKTAFSVRSELCGGYGRRMMNTSISNDAPDYFLNPERVPTPLNKLDPIHAKIIGSRVPTKQVPFASSYLLPGGETARKLHEMPRSKTPYRTYQHGKQVYLDNGSKTGFQQNDRYNKKIKWKY